MANMVWWLQNAMLISGWDDLLNGPLRQYFSLYQATSWGEGERIEMIDKIDDRQSVFY